MRIDKIKLTNYRGHKSLEVDFAPKFNVVVGINGAGKTSLLASVADTFYGFLFTLPMPTGIFSPLVDSDVRVERISHEGRLRFEQRFPAKVEAFQVLNGASIAWGLSRKSAAEGIHVAGDAPGIFWRQSVRPMMGDAIESEEDSPLPVLAYYRANRYWSQSQQHELIAVIERTGRLSGYGSCWDAALDGAFLQRWVIAKSLERFQRSSETGLLFDEIDNDELALINSALSLVVEDAKGIRYDMREKNIIIDWLGVKGGASRSTPFANLSDGQKAIVCLVVDIARRMCLLNPQLGLEVVKQTPGIVVIDELDVHLHPKWQRTLTAGLQAAFPSVQFIVASHSPQVLGEVTPDQIIILSSEGASSPQVSYGMDSSAVLEEIMDAPRRAVKIDDQLKSLFESLERNELDDARALLELLKKQAPGIPELNRAEALLNRKEVLGR